MKGFSISLAIRGIKIRTTGATWVAQRFSIAFSQGVILETRIESHVGLPAWSLLLPLPVSLPLSLSLSLAFSE